MLSQVIHQLKGKTLPNHIILLNIDRQSADSFEGSDGELVMSDDKGNFNYDLKDRKIVHNQEVEVSSSSLDDLGDEEEEVEEKKKFKKRKQVLNLLSQHQGMKKHIKFQISN